MTESKAAAVAEQMKKGYHAEAEVVLVEGIYYVVVKGGSGAIPSMVDGIWIRRHPWP